MSAQRGQTFRKPTRTCAIRYRDATGCRRQTTGFRTKAEAREALEEALRRVRLGPLHGPNMTVRALVDTYVAQYGKTTGSRRAVAAARAGRRRP